MGVKINTGKAPVQEDKPLFEATPEAAPASKPKLIIPSKEDTAKALPIAFHMEDTEPYGDWGSMATAPHDRPILVACQIPSFKNKWAYYEVQWFKPPGYAAEGWYVVGTQWHQLWDAMPKGWIERIGHP